MATRSDLADPAAAYDGVRSRRSALWSRVAIVFCIVVTFWPLNAAQFGGWDDSIHFIDNPLFNPPGRAGLWRCWSGPVLDLYVPVTHSAWWAIARLAYRPDMPPGSRLDPWAFHATNVAVHAVCALLVFALVRRCFPRLGAPAATLAACLWACHPLQVESVAWASGTKDVLAGALSIGAILLLIDAVRTSQVNGRGAFARRYAIATSCFILALLSKPSAVMTPALALLLLVGAFARPWRASMWLLVPWFCLSAGAALLGRYVQPATEVDVPVRQRPLIALDALGFYLGKIVWPTRLCVDYGRTPDRVIAAGWASAPWMLAVVVVACSIVFGRRARVPWVATAWMVACLLPVLGLVPFDFQKYSTTADHYVYVALVGPALLVAWLLGLAGRVAAARRSAIAGGAILLLVCAVLSFRQSLTWRDAITLWDHALGINPNSYAAEYHLANTLMHAGRADEAVAHAQATVRMHRTADSLRLLADVLSFAGRADEALQHYQASFALGGESAPVLANYAAALAERGRLDEAIAAYRRALQLDPGLSHARVGLARAEQERAAGAGKR